MKNSIIVKSTLTLSGLIAMGISLAILFAPHAFHASAGIILADDVNLLNEMRASGGFLLACSFFILFGAINAKMATSALAVSGTLYMTYGMSRVVSLVFDGMPSSTMLQIMALEFVIGGICFLVLKFYRLPE